MPRHHRPRQQRIALDPISLAMDQARKLTPTERAQLQAAARAGFEALRTGHGNVEAWQDLADVLNLAEALAERRIAGNLMDTVRTAQAALAALIHRVHAGTGWTLRGPELTALDDGLWLYAVQLNHCSAGEHRRAHAIVRNRISQALAGNAGGRTVVHATPPQEERA